MMRKWIQAALVGGVVVYRAATGSCYEPPTGTGGPPSVNDDAIPRAAASPAQNTRPASETTAVNDESSPVPEGQAAFLAEVMVVKMNWTDAKEAALSKTNIEAAIKDVPLNKELRSLDPLTLGAAMFFSAPSIYTVDDYRALRAWLEREGLVTYSTPAPLVPGDPQRTAVVVQFPHDVAPFLREKVEYRTPLVETRLEYEWTVARQPRRDEYGVQLKLVQRDRPRGAKEFETQARPLSGGNWMMFRAPPNRVVVFAHRLGEARGPVAAAGTVQEYVSTVLVLHTGPRAKELTTAPVEPRFTLPERVLAGENDISQTPPPARALFADARGGGGDTQYGFGPGGQRSGMRSRGGKPEGSSETTSSSEAGKGGPGKGSMGATSDTTVAEAQATQDALAAFALEREVQSLRTAEQLRERLTSDPQASESDTRELETRLRLEVASAFDARQRVFAVRIAEFEQQLARTQRTYAERAETREAIVQRRLAELRRAGAPAAASTQATRGSGGPPAMNTKTATTRSTTAETPEPTAKPRTVRGAGAATVTGTVNAVGRAFNDEPTGRLAFIREGQRLQQAYQEAEGALARYAHNQESTKLPETQETRAQTAVLKVRVDQAADALRQWRDAATAQVRLAELDLRECEAAEQHARNSADRLTKLFEKGVLPSTEADEAKVLLEQSSIRTKRAQVLLAEYERVVKELGNKP